MDPGIISAGISVLGGLFGDDGYSPAQMSRGHIKGLMQAADKFGINPLTLLNAGIPGGAGGKSNNMGAALSDAAMYLGDALAKKTDAAKLEQVSAERDRLQEKVVGLTLRPKVPGVYGPMRMGGPDASDSPGSGGLSSSGGRVRAPVVLPDGGPRPLIETHALDERREVDHKPMSTSGGFMTLSNPNFPFDVYVPTLDGDEALDVTQWPTAALALGASGAFWLGGKMRNVTDRWGITTDGQNYLTGNAREGSDAAKLKTEPKPKPRFKLAPFWHPQTGFTLRMQ